MSKKLPLLAVPLPFTVTLYWYLVQVKHTSNKLTNFCFFSGCKWPMLPMHLGARVHDQTMKYIEKSKHCVACSTARLQLQDTITRCNKSM